MQATWSGEGQECHRCDTPAPGAKTMRLAADDVRSVVMPGCGHYCLEEAPGEILEALTGFLARTGTGRLRHPTPGRMPPWSRRDWTEPEGGE